MILLLKKIYLLEFVFLAGQSELKSNTINNQTLVSKKRFHIISTNVYPIYYNNSSKDCYAA